MVEFSAIPSIVKENLSKKKFYLYESLLISVIVFLIMINLSYFRINPIVEISPPIITRTMSTRSIVNTTSINLDERLCNEIRNNRRQFNGSNHPCDRIVCTIVVHSSGGRLGNRMFMFASAYGLARTHGCRLYAARQIFDQLSSNFNMSMKKDFWFSHRDANSIRDAKIIKTTCKFLPDLLKPNAFQRIELQGYWQSYLYFDTFREEIRQMYSATKDTLSRLANYFASITKNDCTNCSIPAHGTHDELRRNIRTNYNITWIGIHIRLTDFRRLEYASDEQYIVRSMSIYRRRFRKKKLRFLIASDDKPFCEKVFASGQDAEQVFVLPEYFPPMDDLMTLAFCHHSIVTGGTYSFWAAYLAGGDVIHDTSCPTACSSSNYYPPWFQLMGQPKEKLEDK